MQELETDLPPADHVAPAPLPGGEISVQPAKEEPQYEDGDDDDEMN
jgi:hypothetical protein